ncbi:uncharacterized protein LOC134790364 [Cydia splendana]|uniref:uncharacterized protein LOC134790364 n=1 Tax=Cydia splendana TaxID=1100963 RepID=UPI00300D68E5
MRPRAFKDIKQQHPLERLQYAAAGEQSLVESLQRTLPAAAAAAMSALSALARSLLALAALLAVAESGDYDCVTKIIGRTKKHSRSIKSYSPFYVAHPGHRIDTPRIERIPFLDQVGQNVTACNNKPGHRPPTIKASHPDQFSSVDIDPCEDPYGCIVYVTQYFEYPSDT